LESGGDPKVGTSCDQSLIKEMKLMTKLIIKNLVNYETNSCLSYLSKPSHSSYSRNQGTG
jgi:hypothetical protein